MNAIRVIGVGVIVFAFFMLLIIINVRKSKESNLSVLFRILANYLQLIFTSMTLTSSYPETLTSAFSVTEQVGGASQAFLSFDCFIKDSDIKGPFNSNAIFKVFLLLFLPFILFMLIAIIWLGVLLLKPKWVKSLERNLVISFISILFLLHPKLTEQSLGLFR